MHPLTLDELDGAAEDFDGAVLASADHAHFCSSSFWILPAAAALMPPREPWIFRSDTGYVAMMTGIHPRGYRYAEPLEASWGLACPLLGADTAQLANEFSELCHERTADWDLLVLSGLVEDSPLHAALTRALEPRCQLAAGPQMHRWVASLQGGVDGFLRRRSRNFRRSLDRACRQAHAADIRMIAGPHDPAAAFPRLLEVESRSWKGRDEVGINDSPVCEFYEQMVQRLAARDGLRLWFAQQHGRDVGYILGGVFGSRYRGLQFSYDAELAQLALGNVMQLHAITALCDEPVTADRPAVREYDLGATGGHYKRRWAELQVASTVMIAGKR